MLTITMTLKCLLLFPQKGVVFITATKFDWQPVAMKPFTVSNQLQSSSYISVTVN